MFMLLFMFLFLFCISLGFPVDIHEGFTEGFREAFLIFKTLNFCKSALINTLLQRAIWELVESLSPAFYNVQ